MKTDDIAQLTQRVEAERRRLFRGMEDFAGAGLADLEHIVVEEAMEAARAGLMEPLARLLTVSRLRARVSEDVWQLAADALRPLGAPEGRPKVRDHAALAAEARETAAILRSLDPKPMGYRIRAAAKEVVGHRYGVAASAVEDWVKKNGGWRGAGDRGEPPR